MESGKTQDKPYCTCVRNRNDGYTKSPQGDWFVHSKCMKPAKFVYEKIALPKMLAGGENFDEILRRRAIFEQRVEAREQQELTMIAQELKVDERLVRKIWYER